MEKLIKKISDVQNVLNKFNDVVTGPAREIVSTHISYSADQIKSHIESLQNSERELKIGIIGRVKAGKSSLINALLFNGRDVLPKAATPMTAALTTIGSSESFYAEVDFFNSKDISDLAKKKQDYDAQLKQEIISVKSQEKERLQKRNRPGEDVSSIDHGKIEAKAKRILDTRASDLKSAADLYERISRSSINPQSLSEQYRIEASTEAELKGKLYDYVGSDGKFMPFTRSVHIGMPLDSLQDVLVIDTPGLNDAVASREQRTYEMLKECNVVFIVSPAGQFLNAQDLELADRLSKREGIQEIYVVASQVDLQLHGSEKNKHQGVLPDVILSVEKILAKQISSTLSKHENGVLKDIASKTDRLFISSGVCQSILTNGDDLDENAKHALNQLTRNYPDYFSDEKDRVVYLNKLANRAEILSSISQVRSQKNTILQNQVHDFIDVQNKSANEAVEKLLAHFSKEAATIENTDLDTAKERVDRIEEVRSTGIISANELFKDSVEELTSELNMGLKAHLKSIKNEVQGDIDASEGSKTESYIAEKDGIGNWFARKLWGGGSEERSREIITFQASKSRVALEGLREFVLAGLVEATEIYLRKWRKKLSSDMINVLRNRIGDEYIDVDKLGSVCRAAVNQIDSFPEPKVSEMPEELAKSGRLSGRAAEEYIEEASDYLFTLSREANNYVARIKKVVNKISDFEIGEKLFVDLAHELEKTQGMVENKNLTLDKIKRLSKDLEGIL